MVKETFIVCKQVEIKQFGKTYTVGRFDIDMKTNQEELMREKKRERERPTSRRNPLSSCLNMGETKTKTKTKEMGNPKRRCSWDLIPLF